jgi:hypothetical protein
MDPAAKDIEAVSKQFSKINTPKEWEGLVKNLVNTKISGLSTSAKKAILIDLSNNIDELDENTLAGAGSGASFNAGNSMAYMGNNPYKKRKQQ